MAAPKDLGREACAQVVAASLGHLLALVQRDGRFIYAHPAGQPFRPHDGYNMLRHCGTLWFMLRAVNDMGLPLTRAGAEALDRAVGYAVARMARPEWIAAPSLALVTKGAVKTGGIGLSLVMLAEYRRALRAAFPGGEVPPEIDDTIAALQTYALAQIEGEDFLHKRVFTDGTVLPFRSDYYTGEVLLGLFVTEAVDPRLRTVTEALLVRRYGLAEQSHWMAYAACEAAERGLVAAPLATAYIAELAQAIIGAPDYRLRRMSTPIACRTEALTRIAQLCQREPGRFPEALREAALATARENLALQLDWYDDGQFWKGDGDLKVQIDYIQHNATGFLNLWQLG